MHTRTVPSLIALVLLSLLSGFAAVQSDIDLGFPLPGLKNMLARAGLSLAD